MKHPMANLLGFSTEAPSQRNLGNPADSRLGGEAKQFYARYINLQPTGSCNFTFDNWGSSINPKWYNLSAIQDKIRKKCAQL